MNREQFAFFIALVPTGMIFFGGVSVKGTLSVAIYWLFMFGMYVLAALMFLGRI